MEDGEREPRHERTEEASSLPESYYLDESDPDILVLRRRESTFVAAFSAQGATSEGIVEAAREDYGDRTACLRHKEGKRAGGQDEGYCFSGAQG